MRSFDQWTEQDQDTSLTRHDVASEALPNKPMYHESFMKAEQCFWTMTQGMLSGLTTSGNAKLISLLGPKLRRTSSGADSTPELVGVLGQTGHGKSTAIGALLGNKDLIREVGAPYLVHGKL